MLLLSWGILLYSNILSSSTFQDDDRPTITKNQDIRNIKDIPKIFHSFNTRFVVGLSFAFNYWLGENHPWGYHLFNVGIHILSAFLVYLMIQLLLQTPQIKKSLRQEHKELMAFFVSAIFLAHPIQTESINYITQRFSSLSAFFYIATIDLFLLARLKNSLPFLGGALLTTIMAMFSKEHTVTLPMMIVLIEYTCWGPLNHDFIHRTKRLLPFILTLGIIPLTLLNTPIDTTKTARIANIRIEKSADGQILDKKVDITRAHLALDRKSYLMTQFNVLNTYLRLLVLPINQNLDYDYPLSKGFHEPKTALSAIFLFIIIFSAFLVFLKERLLAFGIFWFYLTLFPESSIIPIGYVIGEHRLYLPMVGFAIAIAIILVKIVKTPKKLVSLMLIMIFIFSVATYRRNRIWTSEISLWQDTIKKSPRLARAHNNLGAAYLLQKKYQESIPCFNKALDIQPKLATTYLNRGIAYLELKNFSAALSDFNATLRLQPNYSEVYNNIGIIYYNWGDFPTAIHNYTRASDLNPNLAEAYNNRANAYKAIKEYQKALQDYNQAIKIYPKYADAYLNRADLFFKQGYPDFASQDLDRARKLQQRRSSY